MMLLNLAGEPHRRNVSLRMLVRRTFSRSKTLKMIVASLSCSLRILLNLVHFLQSLFTIIKSRIVVAI